MNIPSIGNYFSYNYGNYNNRNNDDIHTGELTPVTSSDSTIDINATECYTCDNRRYQDKSADGSVSFQTPTKISPEAAASAVRAHEAEHVRNEQQYAKEQGREVVSQSVRIMYASCNECGKVYVSGGETRTTTVSADTDYDELFSVGTEDKAMQPGNLLSISA